MISSTNIEKLSINGPRVVGTTPNNPFLFLIPTTGKDELYFKAKNLPDGLKLDQKLGIISGIVNNSGIYNVEITVSDSFLTKSRILNIIAGKNKLAMTPPMGWNSWNVWDKSVSDKLIRDTVDGLISTKLAYFGYNYVNIDDTWEGKRNIKKNNEITSNHKFPNMKSLGNYIHSKGLKFGIYSSPGPKTCGGYEGSYNYENKDVQTYEKWGVDFLKYDWCSYSKIAKKSKNFIPHFFYDDHLYSHNLYPVKELIRPYNKMRVELDNVNRDIVYSLCPITLKNKYNASDWGFDVKANLWRTSGDIKDNWKSVSKIGFRQLKYQHTYGPGYWNDPDMLVVGYLKCDKEPHYTNLSKVEQITHITLWTILSAPLLISCDLNKIDEFTFNLLSNSEVIEINQDPLAKPCYKIYKNGSIEVWKKELWDKTHAIAVFNKSKKEKIINFELSNFKINKPKLIRDVWLKKNLGEISDSIKLKILPHGSMLLKIGFSYEDDYYSN